MLNKFFTLLQKIFTAPVLRNLLVLLILLGIAGGLNYLAMHYRLQRDITFNASNSLEPGSVEVLKQLTGPVNITIYANEYDARLGDIRKIVREFISLYQRYKPDLQLTFINPELEVDKARAAQIRLNGEMVVEYNGRSEHLTKLNEQIFTSTLLRLAHTPNQTVMSLEGHGERKLDGVANFDLGSVFGTKLKQNGFHLNSLNLVLAQEVPSNINLLIITHPQVDLLPGEVDKLLHYVARGGNLLWLIDAEPLHGLERLAEKLDISLPPGIVVDPAAVEMNVPPTWSLGANYSAHAITHNFNLITAFPSARALVWNENPDWQHQVLVEVAARGWVSHSAPGITPHFDKRRDTPGPITVAMALQRTVNQHEQRIVVVGNGAFLANSFAGNGGNVDLGMNMVNWLSSDEHLITLQPRAARDSNLVLNKRQLAMIGISFLLGLPLLLAGIGGFIWWRRRA